MLKYNITLFTNFLMSEPVFMKLGMCIMPPEYISAV
jgi:hypothetical protein